MIIKPSLCCISLELKDKGYSYSTVTRKKYLSTTNKLELLQDKTIHNLKVLKEHLLYCVSKNYNYRIGSGLLPLANLPDHDIKLSNLPDKTTIDNLFNECGKIIKDNNLRVSFHPDQFNVLASSKIDVSNQSVLDLEYHGELLDRLGVERSYYYPINIHINCYNKGQDLEEIFRRFETNYNKLSDSVKKMIVVEDEDKPNSWNVENLYKYFYTRLGIPITYDSHHHRCNPGKLDNKDSFNLAKSTWKNVKPLFHFSNGKFNNIDRSHSDYVYEIHDELFDGSVDIDFEFKGKDYCIDKFRIDFPQYSL